MNASKYELIRVAHFFSDSVDTPNTLRLMQELVKLSNIYISNKKEKKESPNHQLLEGIAKYLTKLLKVLKCCYRDFYTLLVIQVHLSFLSCSFSCVFFSMFPAFFFRFLEQLMSSKV